MAASRGAAGGPCCSRNLRCFTQAVEQRTAHQKRARELGIVRRAVQVVVIFLPHHWVFFGEQLFVAFGLRLGVVHRHVFALAGVAVKHIVIVLPAQNAGEFLEFSPKDLQINQVDVFKLNHWDNPAKRSSLKWIQYTMDWPTIVEMPIHHSTKITSFEQINDIMLRMNP